MIKKVLVGILIILLSTKLYSLVKNDFETLIGFIYMDQDVVLTNIKYFFSQHALFFDTALVTVSLLGILIKGKVGFLLTLLWPYSLLILAIMFLLNVNLWGTNEFAIYWSFTILILANIKPMQEYFKTNLRQQFSINLFSISLAICLLTSIYLINDNYLR